MLFLGSNASLKEKSFYCYVDNQSVGGRLTQMIFNESDYIEMLVKPSLHNDIYACYVVHIMKQYALIFILSIEISPRVTLKLNSIMTTILIVASVILFLYFE